jgi:hypothetical protein
MRRALLAAAAASACLLAGCGGNPGDLLGMQISGGPVRGVEQMHVTEDGRTSCNKGGLHQLSSQTILDARNIEREAKPLIEQGPIYAAAPPGRRTFQLKTPDGTLTWAEGASGLPILLPQAEVLALTLEEFCPKPG